jgi:hypothetical protein
VTDADLNQIEARLGITLPKAYQELMRTRAGELKSLTHEFNGETLRWFDNMLWLDADEIIEVNLAERQWDADTEDAFPGWARTFFLIGTNGAGDFYCLRLKGDRKVWMIGSDCGLEPTEMHPTLLAYVQSELRRYQEETPWEPPPVRSSFDDSCPLLERFAIYIGGGDCEIASQEGDRPLTAAKLQQHGIDLEKLGRRTLQLVAVLAKCDADALKIKVDRKPNESGSLVLHMSPIPIGDK